jgi:hypothetical protein
MSREQVIRMARQAWGDDSGKPWSDAALIHLEAFAALVAAAERERLHNKFMEIHNSQQHSNNYWHFAARKILEEA